MKSFYKFDINLLNSKTKQSSKTEIHINILDKNDHYPIFEKSYEQYIYISTHHQQNNSIFITHIHATDDDIDSNGFINYCFTNKDHYDYFHLYSNGSIFLYNLDNIHLPLRLEIYARDQGYPTALDSKESIIIYICDIYKRNECLSNELSKKLRRNFYLGSIFLLISVVLFLLIIILCIVWNLFIRKKGTNKPYHHRMEARKNLSNKKFSIKFLFFFIFILLVVSDSLENSSPLIHLKAAVV